MYLDSDPQHTLPKYWNTSFERAFGDLLQNAIVILFPNIVIDAILTEKDIFYYKLKVIQSLLDPTIKVGTPSKELFYAFSSDVKLSQEYDEFAEMIRFIRLNDSNAKEVLTEAVVLKCEEVISNPAIASFFFIFNAPLKEMH